MVNKRPRPGGRKVRAGTQPAGESLPLKERLRLREAFFRRAGIDPRQFLHAFDHIPGLNYFVKDADSRTMLNNREFAQYPGRPAEEEFVGKRPSEYIPKDLADHYETDDRKVYQTGQPLRNIIEIGFNEQGVPDWIITDKFPIKDARGRVIGIMGTMQRLERRIEALPHLGEVGKAAAFIRENLGRRLHLSDVADHVGSLSATSSAASMPWYGCLSSSSSSIREFTRPPRS